MFGNNPLLEEAIALYGGHQVLERIKSDGRKALARSAEEKEVTLLMQDVRPFPRFSEKLSAAKFMEMMNDYLDEMSEVIVTNGGAITGIQGNAISAYWGAEGGKMVSVVRQLKAAGAKVSQKWATDLPQPLVPIHGIEYGVVLHGNFGSKHRMNYTMLGDTVNFVARLCSANVRYGTQSIFSERALLRLAEAHELKLLDTFVVKGRTHPERIFSLEEQEQPPSP